ncbi:MAG: DUF4143 domain-containing protein [Erysipelotrichaceae bacterium]
MKNRDYKSRIIDSIINDYLDTFGAVCIEGPKWCGKTWTSSYHCNSKIMLGDPTGNFQNRLLAEVSPALILDGATPRLIDEWQEVPPIWDAVRHKVDQTSQRGQFILTGSSTPSHKGILHSGAGRIAKLRMRTMSLYESNDSSGKVSLRELCYGNLTPSLTGDVDLKNLINLIIRGGWPGSVNLKPSSHTLLPKQYLEAIINDDIYRMDGINRNKNKLRLLLRSLARNESTTATNNTLIKDVRGNDNEIIDANTISSYLDILDRLFITENQPPFSSNIRSSVRVKQAEKRHFCDPSLACALLDVSAEGLLNDLNTLGFLFEALCERDLRIYCESFGGTLYHYQDYKGKEIDAIIELPDKTWCAFEIKLGTHQIDDAARSLISIQREIEKENKQKSPKILCVISGLSTATYRRDDGVFVVPITALRE